MEFIKVETYEQLSAAGAGIIADVIKNKPNAILGLATGSSPEGIYANLVKMYESGELDFSAVKSVNLDEYVGLDGSNDQSYRYFMQDKLFNHVNIKPENTHVPNGCAEDFEKECYEYDKMIKDFGGSDIQLLGIGLDGHIGFNEPDSYFEKNTHLVDLHESTIKANARFFENEDEVPKKAITMGMLSIMSAKKILLIASGSAKKDIIEKAVNGPITPEVPASILQLHPDATVIYSEK